MITMIFGLPRVGKTALMTSLAVNRMQGAQACKDIADCRKIVSKLNAGGYSLHAPSDHLVFADYSIFSRGGARHNYEVDGFSLGLPGTDHVTAFLPPYANIYLDEAQKYLNSRLSSKLADFVSRFYELHGHYYLNITMTGQRPGLIDLNVRELAAEVIEVVELKHKKDQGIIVQSEWVCNVFNSASAALNYIDSGKRKGVGKRQSYFFNGNIFRHYDSHNFLPAFLADRAGSDFDVVEAKKFELNSADIDRFNKSHSYAAPDTYYKG